MKARAVRFSLELEGGSEASAFVTAAEMAADHFDDPELRALAQAPQPGRPVELSRQALERLAVGLEVAAECFDESDAELDEAQAARAIKAALEQLAAA